MPPGTWDRAVLPTCLSLMLLIKGPEHLSDGDKTLMSLPVISHPGVKGDPSCLWWCFQGTILYLKFFFQNQLFASCCFLPKKIVNQETCPILSGFWCSVRTENSHPPIAGAEIHPLQLFIFHWNWTFSASATVSGGKCFQWLFDLFQASN